MNPMRNKSSFGELRESGEGPSGCEGVTAGDDEGSKAESSLVARFLMFTSRGRSLEDRVYIDGTCKLNAMIK